MGFIVFDKVFWKKKKSKIQFFSAYGKDTSRLVTCLVMLSLLRQNHQRPDFFGILSLTHDSTVAWKQSTWVSQVICQSWSIQLLPTTSVAGSALSQSLSNNLHIAETLLEFLTWERWTVSFPWQPGFMAVTWYETKWFQATEEQPPQGLAGVLLSHLYPWKMRLYWAMRTN